MMALRTLPGLFAGVLTASVGLGEAFVVRLDFGSDVAAPGWTTVTPGMAYDAARGYGFESGPAVEAVDRDHGGAVRRDFVTGSAPFCFSVAVPSEGNFRVTATLGDARESTNTTIKAELRRLMVDAATTAPGEFTARTFIVNTRTAAIGGTDRSVRLKEREKTSEAWAWDDKLTLEFLGPRPAVCALEIERVDDVPTLFLLGDSTVTDQPREPYASWGQMLTAFFRPDIAIANHGQSGEAYSTARAAGRLDKVLSLLRPGDFVLLQFGHNDEKQKRAGAGPFLNYTEEMHRYVAAIREKGGLPVLLTPMQRRGFDDAGRLKDTHGDYPVAVRKVAAEDGVPLIDLQAMSTQLYEAFGPEASGILFKEGDGTHHNPYGAYELARCVVEGVRASVPALAGHLRADIPRFDPARPDRFESFRVPPSGLGSGAKPDGS